MAARLAAALLLGAGLLLLGCRGSTHTTQRSGAQKGTVSVTDALGRKVTLARAAQRIVSLQPNNTEILFALGLGDRVVAVTKYCDYPPEAKQKPNVGDLLSPSVERILSFQPGLVLVGQGTDMRVVQALESMGVPTFAVHPKTVASVLRAVLDVGQLCGVGPRAEQLAASLRARMVAVTEKTSVLPPARRPRVLYGYPEVPVQTASGRTFVGDIIRLAGGTNIGEDNPFEWPALSLEAIIKADPQVILSGYSSDYLSREESLRRWAALKSQPAWRQITAVKTERISMLNLDVLLRPGPRVFQGLEEVARFLHPELFGEARP